MLKDNSKEVLLELLRQQNALYDGYCKRGLSLNISRGKPSDAQLDISLPLLENTSYMTEDGIDCRNYGAPFGIPAMRALWSDMVGIPEENIVVGANSSLHMMFDSLMRAMVFGTVHSPRPWMMEPERKFLCPAPGYDRHFRMTETLGFTLLTVPMTEDGPDMDVVEELVGDPTVKGIWCVPKYSNPTGVVYSDATIRRLMGMEAAAPDFTVMWDNAYDVHGFTEEEVTLPNVLELAATLGHPSRPLVFSSTSKITFAGGGVAMMGASDAYWQMNKPILSTQSIGPDKLNQLRHVAFLRDMAGVKEQMVKHAATLRPKFDALHAILDRELGDTGIAKWTKPRGGYFVSLDLMDGCAKRTYELCQNAGVTLTEAGATYPYGIDPHDANLRIAPSFCTMEDLTLAAEILCCSCKIAALELLTR